MTTQIIIDTDPGVDDAFAILLALASPEVKLEALTSVHGNIGIENTTRNALAILELANASHIPVARGCEQPLITSSHQVSGLVHGFTGIGDSKLPEPKTKPVQEHAIDYLIQRVLAEPKQISIFPIAPLTNIALAIRKEPKFAESVKELVIMGGAIRSGGNSTPLAEFNIHMDPHAAHIIFHSGIPITLIPLDVTHKCLLMPEHIERLNKKLNSPISHFIHDAMVPYMDFYQNMAGLSGSALHDPLTLATVIAPDLLTLEEHHVDVDISGGISTGNTFADLGNIWKQPANMKVAVDVRGEDFINLFLERMETLSRSISD